jgi:lysozyme family protein
MSDVKKLVPFILRWEGGFVDDPLDKGGATNKGVTIATFRQVFGQERSVEDLKNITDEQWMKILKQFYWDRWKADEIDNQSIANILVDWVWASGKWGVVYPQKLLDVIQDGKVGSKTIAAINRHNPEELFNKIVMERKAFVSRIVQRTPSQIRFLKGWLNRINAFKFEP